MSRVEDRNQIQEEIECNNQCRDQAIQNLVDERGNNLCKIKTNRSSKFPMSNLPESFTNSIEIPNQIFPNSTNSGNSNNSENSDKNNYNEAFTSLIKEFLQIEHFPSERKQKGIMLKKFSSIYKKIKYDKSKMNNFINRMSERLNETRDDIIVN